MSAFPAVSVVTPFHNTAPYLAQCIESVLAQTFTDFEYVLVDNQSTDGSSEIAERYAAKDARIRLQRTDRLLPQVQNYNFALSRISPGTRWCKLVQADDWIAPECLARMVAVGDSSASVGIVGSYTLKGVEVKGSGLPYDATVSAGRDICRLHLLEGRFLFGSPTALLYRASTVRQRVPFYEEDRLHEDTELCFELLKSWDFGFVHQVLAFQRTANAGISSRAENFNPHLLDAYIVLKRFGPHFLTGEEYRRRSAELQTRYDRYLGESLLLRRTPSLWTYHDAGLATVGERRTAGRLARGVFLAVSHHILNPTRALRRAWRRITAAR
jgi:glycosyltransferase involved in cell wall biosynthesis